MRRPCRLAWHGGRGRDDSRRRQAAQPPQFAFVRTFELSHDAERDELTLITTLRDDKGEAEYRERFRRAP
jgi:hypothetical protein